MCNLKPLIKQIFTYHFRGFIGRRAVVNAAESFPSFLAAGCMLLFQVKALANKDTLLPTQMFPRLPAWATFVSCGHKFCVRDTKIVSDIVLKHFVSATNVFQFAQPKKHHEQQCIRNDVSSFARALMIRKNFFRMTLSRLSETSSERLCEGRGRWGKGDWVWKEKTVYKGELERVTRVGQPIAVFVAEMGIRDSF